MPKQSIADRKKALQEQLAALDAEEKQQAEKRHKIIGRVFDSEADDNPTLRSQIDDLLQRKLTNTAERKLFGLPKLETKRGRPASTDIPQAVD